MIAVPGCLYKHFKGNLYKVLCIAQHTETCEELVVYEAMYGEHKIWCRPRAMWEGQVSDPSLNERMIPRFEAVEVFPTC